MHVGVIPCLKPTSTSKIQESAAKRHYIHQLWWQKINSGGGGNKTYMM